MKEAILYERLEDDFVRCMVCNHQCTIKPGKTGICGVRENRQGTLFALNYGMTAAIGVDPIEKKPLYHFMSGTKTYSLATAGCNLHCKWCQNWQLSQRPIIHPKETSGTLIKPSEHVENAIKHDCPSLSYTYSEPTIFIEYALDTMVLARAKGLKNIWVTNGFMTPEALTAVMPYLDAANVDLKGSTERIYKRFCGGDAESVMRNLIQLHRGKVHLEITTLIILGVNDSEAELSSIAEFISRDLSPEVPWHLSRFFPGWKMSDKEPTPYETLLKAKKIGHEAGLNHIYLGNV
ncbi:MAG: AmmeMemoRadiSam system radical SAM enzyme [Acholeplasmataceae bacterium]|nr:AmmeMemoRadiSam system radical SAM enzyme [Acholeplasmataceae bacterium]